MKRQNPRKRVHKPTGMSGGDGVHQPLDVGNPILSIVWDLTYASHFAQDQKHFVCEIDNYLHFSFT